MEYDSRPDTYQHIQLVQRLLHSVVRELMYRGENHDQSKLKDPELAGFNAIVPLLATLTYGSPEYKATLKSQEPVIAHHYAHNRHHPEHFENGIDGMNLIDLLEMACDWEAAARRKGGHAIDSLVINSERFNIDRQL